MNQIILGEKLRGPGEYMSGDIFRRGDDFYLLTEYNGQFWAVNFCHGTVWDGPNKTPKEAVEGLHFVGRGLKITIEP